MRPGPRRPWAISKPRPSPSRMSRLRHPHVVVDHLGMAVRGVVIAEHVQHLDDLDALGVARHDDHRLLAVGRRVGIALAHQDDDLAARIAHARRPPLAAVDDVVVAVALDAALDVARVGRGHRRLGHGEARADLAVEQRLQPLLLVLLGAVAGEHLHVAGVGRRAVDRFRKRSTSGPALRRSAHIRGWRGPSCRACRRSRGRPAGTCSTGRASWPRPCSPRGRAGAASGPWPSPSALRRRARPDRRPRP